jgi:hypothetical protein
MAVLVNFIIGLVAKATTAMMTNLSAEAQSTPSQLAINTVVQQLPGELGGMIVDFLNGMAGLVTALSGLLT